MWLKFEKHLWKIVYRGIIQSSPSMELIKWDETRIVLRKIGDSKRTSVILRPIDNQVYHRGTHFESVKTPMKKAMPKEYVVSEWINDTNPLQALNSFARSLGGTLRTTTSRVVIEFITDDVELDAGMRSTIGIEVRRLKEDGKYDVISLIEFAEILARKGVLKDLYLHCYAGDDHPVLHGDVYIPLK